MKHLVYSIIIIISIISYTYTWCCTKLRSTVLALICSKSVASRTIYTHMHTWYVRTSYTRRTWHQGHTTSNAKQKRRLWRMKVCFVFACGRNLCTYGRSITEFIKSPLMISSAQTVVQRGMYGDGFRCDWLTVGTILARRSCTVSYLSPNSMSRGGWCRRDQHHHQHIYLGCGSVEKKMLFFSFIVNSSLQKKDRNTIHYASPTKTEMVENERGEESRAKSRRPRDLQQYFTVSNNFVISLFLNTRNTRNLYNGWPFENGLKTRIQYWPFFVFLPCQVPAGHVRICPRFTQLFPKLLTAPIFVR